MAKEEDKFHGNDKRNMRDHHLYEIADSLDDEVVKYGICGDELNADGSSPRANEQVNFLNRAVGWIRFIARVILKTIPGRQKALEIEDEHVAEFEAKNGHRPRGNPPR